MKLLVDTHLLLWAAAAPWNLSPIARRFLADAGNILLFSPVSLWEVAIKRSLGRPDFTADPRTLKRGLLENGYVEVPVTSTHAVAVAALPPIHKDPFDRMLVAQVLSEGVTLLTADSVLASYPISVRKV
ncbi:PIN domain-containing protein [Mesorhizobium sp. NBSH29]|uniref:type II toxin-antitoxin system VapC family toxin n=1 Tax=Mesorhizobium sp. NBSH29 TaxID=2654249 RepID=UPI0018965E49|nr:type II toxin-antitoxin system VapC family toxin [Mesorhizobium sp. NBSH29]QPC87684.1 PIN domain-containing protein [Mesorhizobium sp. NBSH29]